MASTFREDQTDTAALAATARTGSPSVGSIPSRLPVGEATSSTPLTRVGVGSTTNTTQPMSSASPTSSSVSNIGAIANTGPSTVLSASTNTTGAFQSSQPKQVVWGISWTQPIWMIVFLLCGILLAIGHHLYYNSLNGTRAGSPARQQWPIRFGTAFAYLTTSSLNAAVGIAFTQQLWRSIKQKPYSVDGLDKIFAITTDPTSFWSLEVLRSAKVVVIIALLAWTLPLTAIVPPATLTVTQEGIVSFRNMAIGIPDWNADALIAEDYNPLPSDILLKIASQTAERVSILPIQPPAANSSYDLLFFGPTIRCSPANDVQQKAFDHYTMRSAVESEIYPASEVADLASTVIQDPDDDPAALVYSVFSPRFSWLQQFASPGPSKYNNWQPELGDYDINNVTPANLLLQQLWVQLANENFVCQIANASFDIRVEHTNNEQKVTINGVNPSPAYHASYLQAYPGQFENLPSCDGVLGQAECTSAALWTRQITYLSWFGALVSQLTGNITLPVFASAPIVATQLLQSGLGSCPEISDNFWIGYCEENKQNAFCDSMAVSYNFTEALPPTEPYWCRNGSLARALEDLANNITISMLSYSPWLTGNAHVLADHSVQGVVHHSPIVPVTITTNENVYTYDWSSLVIPYAIAVGLASATVLLGGYTFYSNGVSHSSSFSAVVATTRNPALDALMEGQSLGAAPRAEDVLKTRLRFGLLDGGLKAMAQGKGSRHVAFGVGVGGARRIVKGEPCS